ncbi:MAG: AMIN domain-containing protein [Cyanobacteria bacterium P01_D01_bin.44]
MKRRFKFGSLMAGGAFAILASQPAQATTTLIEDVKINPTAAGLELTLSTKAGDTPQVFAASKGNRLQAEITNARLARGKSFLRENPTPGVASIQLEAINDNSVRLTIDGKTSAPVSEIQKMDGRGLLISLDTRPNAVATPSELPESIETVPGLAGEQIAQDADPAEEAPTEEAPTEEAPAEEPAPEQPEQTEQTPDVLVPNPEVIIDGAPVSSPTFNGAPPFLPRAVAPPVGDLSVSDVDANLDVIDLGTAERVPRLVLRDAPAREVLSLLARAANLNLAFTDASAEEASEEVRVTLDIENEPVQNVFNYVLQISGLEANRVGRTIFVGPQLPTGARNVIVRSVRLNQVDLPSAVNFLVTMGAESAITRERLVTSVNAVEVGEGAPITETQSVTESRIENQRVEFEDADPILRGLQVVGDERTNSVTLIGTPRQVQIATSQLTQLDLRRRQVAVNVRVIDVNLNAIDRFGTSFSFGLGDVGVLGTAGQGIINFGDNAPNTGNNLAVPPALLGVPITPGVANPFNVASQFLLQLQAVVTNGQAKILTDPTLVVQEGQTAVVQLTEEVVTDIDIENSDIGDSLVQTIEFETEPAGLNLQVQIERIDDNGFVTLAVAPSITAPVDSFDTGEGVAITLLSERQLSSGQVRVRDGQTLILSGIIQETDQVSVQKVPILGDLPLLGALFRSTSRSNERQEVIVLLTPQIIDDSDQSVFGYSYTPGEDVQELLEDRSGPNDQ